MDALSALYGSSFRLAEAARERLYSPRVIALAAQCSATSAEAHEASHAMHGPLRFRVNARRPAAIAPLLDVT